MLKKGKKYRPSASPAIIVVKFGNKQTVVVAVMILFQHFLSKNL